MTEPTPPNDPLDSIEASEAGTVTRLRADRPIPAPAFRGELKRHLGSEPGGPRSSFGAFSPRTLATGYLGAGLILLAVAAAGLAGAGPFGA